MHKPSRQRGAIAIEFALVFGLFVALLYAIVGYGMVFMLVQSFTWASEDSLRAAIAVDCKGLSTTNCVNTRIRPAVQAQAVASLNWLPANVQTTVLGTAGAKVEVTCDTTTCEAVIRYPSYDTNPMLPIIDLPLVGKVPRVPRDLVGRARLRI